jgi:hypothetical protein
MVRVSEKHEIGSPLIQSVWILGVESFNSWGQLVFSTHNWQEKRNGKVNGIAQL